MLRTLLFCFLCVGVPLMLIGSESKPKRIILIQADDLGYDDLGISGNTLVRTPNLDRLARESVQAFDFTVNPVCAPSRATLLTGRHFLRTGVSHVHGGKDFLHPGERTMADVFTEAGWQTAVFGKWHLGTGPGYEPWGRGFKAAARLQLYQHKRAVFTESTGIRKVDRWADAALVDAAIGFLEANRAESSFLYLASMTPHAPLRAPEEHVEPYRKAGLSAELAELYGMISHLDMQVGRLLAWLETNDMSRDTVVIFTSDNGAAVNRSDLGDEDRRLRKAGASRGWKGDLWQGGVRAPLFVRWPGVLQPGVVATPLDQADLFPTLLAWCGLSSAAGDRVLDGRNIDRELRLGEKGLSDERRIFNYSHAGWLTSERAYSPRGLPGEYNPVEPEFRLKLDPSVQTLSVRQGRYKLLRNPNPPNADGSRETTGVLIDLFEDPGEAVDVSARVPAVRQELDRALDVWFAGVLAEPHAFTAPTHHVREVPFALSARTPCRIMGDLQNTVQALEGWGKPGAVASYALKVAAPVEVAVELVWSEAPPDALVVEVSVEGRQEKVELRAATGWRSETPLVLVAGSRELQLRSVAGVSASSAGALASIRLLPLAKRAP